VLPLSVLPLWFMMWLLRYLLPSLWKKPQPVRLIVGAGLGVTGSAALVGQMLLYRMISGIAVLKNDNFFMATWCTMNVVGGFILLNSNKFAKSRQRDNNID